MAGFFVWMIIRKNRRHGAEAGKSAIYATNCTGTVGWITYKGVFLRLAVYAEFLVVACNRVYYFPFSEIMHIERHNFLFRRGYRIHHKNPSYPQRIEVWPENRDAFEAAIAGKTKII